MWNNLIAQMLGQAPSLPEYTASRIIIRPWSMSVRESAGSDTDQMDCNEE